MEIGVSESILTHNIIKGCMGKLLSYSTIWEENIVEVLHIYGARAIFLHFCDQQDTELE